MASIAHACTSLVRIAFVSIFLARGLTISPFGSGNLATKAAAVAVEAAAVIQGADSAVRAAAAGASSEIVYAIAATAAGTTPGDGSLMDDQVAAALPAKRHSAFETQHSALMVLPHLYCMTFET